MCDRWNKTGAHVMTKVLEINSGINKAWVVWFMSFIKSIPIAGY